MKNDIFVADRYIQRCVTKPPGLAAVAAIAGEMAVSWPVFNYLCFY